MIAIGLPWEVPLLYVAVFFTAMAVRRYAIDESWDRSVLASLFACYVVALVAATIMPLPIQPSVIADGRRLPMHWNLVPLHTVWSLMRTESTGAAARQAGMNVLAMVPLGVLLPLMYSRLRSFRAFVIVAISVAVGVEGVQAGLSAAYGYLYKTLDIDNAILSLAGAILGFCMFSVTARVRGPAARWAGRAQLP